MATTTFADRIKKAAGDFPGATSTAWVQYLAGRDSTVSVRMQAPEITKQFRGNVKFGTGRSNDGLIYGTDVKGILFFRESSDLDVVGNIKVRNARYPVSGSIVVVETEFGPPGAGFDAIARFVAQVDTVKYPIPEINANAIGVGQMRPFDALTCHMMATRVRDKFTVNLGAGTIRVELDFTSQRDTSFGGFGVLFLQNIARLKSVASGLEYCVANYSPDRIVFHIENAEDDVVALFLPNSPISTIGPMSGPPPRVTWEGIQELAALARDDEVHVEGDGGVVE